MAMAFGRRRIVCVLVLCLATVADEGVCVGGLCAGPDFEASVREAHSKRYAEAVTSVARGGLAADAITELEAVLAAVEAEASAAYAAFRATVLGDLGKALATDSRVEEAVAAWRAAVDIWPRTGGDAAPFEAFRNLVQSTMLHAAQFSRRLLVERPQDFLVEAQAALFCEAVGDRAAAAQHLAASAKLLQATPALDDHALAPAVRRGLGRIYAAAGRPADAARELGAGLRGALPPRCDARGAVGLQLDAQLQHDFIALAQSTCGWRGEAHADCADAWSALLTPFEAMLDGSRWRTRRLAAASRRSTLKRFSLVAASAVVTAVKRGAALGDSSVEAHAANVLAARSVGERGVRAGALNSALQAPRHLVVGLETSESGWYDAAAWPIVQMLEDNYEAIRAEVLAAAGDGRLDGVAMRDSVAALVSQGDWAEVDIVRSGLVRHEAVNVLPFTASVVLSLPGNAAASMVRGGAKVSVLEPGTVIEAHTGSTNTRAPASAHVTGSMRAGPAAAGRCLFNRRLRVHLGLDVPPGTLIAVGDAPPRTWAEGKCLVFDDSFVHAVWQNHTTRARTVLIVDVWHPGLDEAAKLESLEDSPHLRDVFKQWASRTAPAHTPPWPHAPYDAPRQL